jgi:hypothetical protein
MGSMMLIAASIFVLGQAGHDILSGTLDQGRVQVSVEGSDTVCEGSLRELAPRMGRGDLVCSDHREGYFRYSLQEDGTGVAYGRLGSESLVLTFD